MMSKRNKKIFTITIIILIILIILISIAILYLKTDLFKSNKMLFTKYFSQNSQNLEQVYKTIANDEYLENLNQNKYTTEESIKVNYTENIGTSSENTNNSINNLELKINGQTDLNSNYNYKDIQLLKDNKETENNTQNNEQSENNETQTNNNEEQNATITNETSTNNSETNNQNTENQVQKNENKLAEIEYAGKDDTYGIKFTDLFNQFIIIDNEKLNDVFEKLGFTEDKINNASNTLETNSAVNSIKFTDEELQNITSKYVKILIDEFSKGNFSKKKNENIKINNQTVNTNKYELKITIEQINDIYIKLLEELKQDDVILAKFENAQKYYNSYALLTSKQEKNLKDNFVKNIENKINEIKSNNIGQDEVTVSVYENNKKTVRTLITTKDYQLCYDFISNENIYSQFSYTDTQEEKEQSKKVTLNKKENKIDLNYEEIEDESEKNISFEKNENQNNNESNKDTLIKYEDSKNKVEMKINEKNKIVNKFENEISFKDDNSVKLNQLDENDLQEIVNKVDEALNDKIETLAEEINDDDINKVLIAIGVVKEKEEIQSLGITETEKNRFNSQFELFNNKEAKKEDISKIIEAVKNNLVGLETESSTKLKLKLDRNNSDEEMYNKLKKYMENMKDNTYNVSIEYDETTGLAQYVVLEIIKN